MIRDAIRVGQKVPPLLPYALSYVVAVPRYLVFKAWYLIAEIVTRERFLGFSQSKN